MGEVIEATEVTAVSWIYHISYWHIDMEGSIAVEDMIFQDMISTYDIPTETSFLLVSGDM